MSFPVDTKGSSVIVALGQGKSGDCDVRILLDNGRKVVLDREEAKKLAHSILAHAKKAKRSEKDTHA